MTRMSRAMDHGMHGRACVALSYAAVITITIRLRFDGRSTAYQKSLRSQLCDTLVTADPRAAVTLSYLFI